MHFEIFAFGAFYCDFKLLVALIWVNRQNLYLLVGMVMTCCVFFFELNSNGVMLSTTILHLVPLDLIEVALFKVKPVGPS